MVSGRPLSMHVDKVNPTGGVVNLTYTASEENQKDITNTLEICEENILKQEQVEICEEKITNTKLEQISELASVDSLGQASQVIIGESNAQKIESKDLYLNQTNISISQNNFASKTNIIPQLNIRMGNPLGGMTAPGGNHIQYGGYAMHAQGNLLQNLPNLNLNPNIQGNIPSNIQTNLPNTLQTPNLNPSGLNTNMGPNFNPQTPFMNFNQNLQQMHNFNPSSLPNFNPNYPPQNFPQNMIPTNMSMNIPQNYPQNFNFNMANISNMSNMSNMSNLRQPSPQFGTFPGQSSQGVLTNQIQSSQIRNNIQLNGSTTNFPNTQTNNISTVVEKQSDEKNITTQQGNSNANSKTTSNINILNNFVQAISTLQKLNQSQGQTDKSKDPRTRKKKP
jgi:hypothetical protein